MYGGRLRSRLGIAFRWPVSPDTSPSHDKRFGLSTASKRPVKSAISCVLIVPFLFQPRDHYGTGRGFYEEGVLRVWHLFACIEYNLT